MSELLPCPFCDERRISLNKPNEHDRYGSINCPACMAALPGACSDEGELVRSWNARASGWQPIETAPKDGTDVLLHYDGRAPAVAAWFRIGWAPMDLGGNHLLGEPTHWMPLPAPPVEAKSD